MCGDAGKAEAYGPLTELLDGAGDVLFYLAISPDAASEGIGVAKAAFFPSIQLTGSAGVESVDLKNIFNWESRIWSIGPNISLPLFEGGRIRAGVAQARAFTSRPSLNTAPKF